MLFGVASIDRATLINNVVLMAKVAKEFGVPTVLTAVETESFSGSVWPRPAGGRTHLHELLGRSRLPAGHRGHRPQEHAGLIA